MANNLDQSYAQSLIHYAFISLDKDGHKKVHPDTQEVMYMMNIDGRPTPNQQSALLDYLANECIQGAKLWVPEGEKWRYMKECHLYIPLSEYNKAKSISAQRLPEDIIKLNIDRFKMPISDIGEMKKEFYEQRNWIIEDGKAYFLHGRPPGKKGGNNANTRWKDMIVEDAFVSLDIASERPVPKTPEYDEDVKIGIRPADYERNAYAISVEDYKRRIVPCFKSIA